MLGGKISGGLVALLIASTAAPVALAEQDPDGGQCVDAYLDVAGGDPLAAISGLGIDTVGTDVAFSIPTFVPAGRDGFYVVEGTVTCAGNELDDLIKCVRGAVSPEQLEGCL